MPLVENRRATITVLLVITLVLFSFPQIEVDAQTNTIVVPDDFSSIQEAVNAASEGDTVFVKNGIYFESVTIDKSLSLEGENKESTIIDGNNLGPSILINHNSVNITGFRIRNVLNAPPISDSRGRLAGIHLLDVQNCQIFENEIVNCGKGVWLYGSSENNIFRNSFLGCNFGVLLELSHNNIITENLASNNWGGIWVEKSKNNILRDNNMTNNIRNFGVVGLELSEYINNVDDSNFVNNKKVYYLINKQNLMIDSNSFPDLGFLALVNCMNITIHNLDISNNYYGLFLVYSPNSKVTYNSISNNSLGIWLQFSPNCIVSNNNLRENSESAILIEQSHNTLITANSATENGDAIRFVSTNNSTIVENEITGKIKSRLASFPNTNIPIDSGVDFRSSSNNSILNNVFISGDCGIEFSRSSDNNITSNHISLCRFYGIKIDNSNSTNIIENEISKIGFNYLYNWGSTGIDIDDSIYTRIIENNINQNEWGINFDGFSTFTGQSNVIGNNITNSGQNGIRIYASNDNLFYKNNFVNNTKHVEEAWDGHPEWMSINIWDNGKEGNYWDDYNGEDRNGDGIGDSPYTLYTGNQDNYPLMNPVVIPEFHSWTLLIVGLITAFMLSIIYRRRFIRVRKNG